MDSGQKPTVPILSTAGAVPVKTEKGVSMQKVKVNRYVTGKRPDYAPDSSSGESDEEFIQKKPGQKPVVKEVEEEPEESFVDRRLRRLQEARKSRVEESDSDSDDDRVARHRRQVIEPEIIAEGTDSEEERVRRRAADDDESSEEEEELDDEEIERRRNLLRQRALQRKQEEDILDLEDEKPGESDEESSEYEEYSDSEEETGPRLKPVFVRKKDRFSVQDKERSEAKAKELEAEAKKLAEERRKQTLKIVEEERRREIEAEKVTQDACDLLDSGDENDEEAYEAWKVRELKRLKRDREERENLEKEKLEIERIHNMTEEERRQEFQHNPKQRTNKAPKGKYKFLQKYYHRGAFFMDRDDDSFKRDFAQPTLEDHFDKTVLPKVMQVKNFGRSGRTKYTHLVDQDTTQFDSPWVSDTAMNIKFHNQKGGGTKQIFDRPSQKKKK
ncbi:microfibrillar-associated protein 1-like [Mercenaria mercenaria]|uniref:microfibrillar-associated protein 1-like n=1 Tax=Mercenaria mercenaria TaxID=6596 RepID=UPI00234F8D2C|nr:microfibrillar-associated protein 1-like [Mercenaria mercenaria]